ncbi:MAG: hypothetical protein OER97_09750 [Gammaproteobacteria bacterium]|nr:hypothetical protein [Gammaproteobacteria bacterium]
MKQLAMNRFIQKNALVAGLTALMLAFPAQSTVNKSVKIEDGATASGASSVNGSVTVGENATVNGELSTVNGAIRVGEGSVIESAGTVNGSVRIANNVKSEDLETVNGAINIAENAEVKGNVAAVNGGIRLDQGSTVSKDLSNVNGDIELTASQVGGDVSTVSGDIELAEGAAILGDLIVEEPKGFFRSSNNSKRPKVIIGPGCRVDGVLRLEREVKLYISETAQVGGVEGKMTMADAVRYSGKRP